MQTVTSKPDPEMNNLSTRKLTPEILDSISHDDPGAIRSRRDLRRINRFMGSESWILQNIPPDTSSITLVHAATKSWTNFSPLSVQA